MHAVVIEVNEAGMYRLATTRGVLMGVHSRKQFEPLPAPFVTMNKLHLDTEIALRTVANKQSQGGGQGFVKCGFIKTCQGKNCKC